MLVYLVKRQDFAEAGDNVYVEDTLIAICSTMKLALQHVDRPNFDIIITSYEVDGGPDSERLMKNIESYRKEGQ